MSIFVTSCLRSFYGGVKSGTDLAGLTWFCGDVNLSSPRGINIVSLKIQPDLFDEMLNEFMEATVQVGCTLQISVLYANMRREC